MSTTSSIICPRCHLHHTAYENFCGNCGYPLRGSSGSYPTVQPANQQQSHITRILDALVDDSLPHFSPQPLSQTKRSRRRLIVFTVLVLLLLGVLFLGIELGKVNPPVSAGNAQR